MSEALTQTQWKHGQKVVCWQLFLENFLSVLYCGWLGGCSAEMEHVLKLHLYPVSLSPDSCFTFSHLPIPPLLHGPHPTPRMGGYQSLWQIFRIRRASGEALIGEQCISKKRVLALSPLKQEARFCDCAACWFNTLQSELRGPHTSCTQPDQRHDNDNR